MTFSDADGGMAENPGPEGLARSIAERYGVTPVPGFRVDMEELVLPIVGRRLSMVAVAEGNWYLRLHFWGMPDFVLEVEGSASVQPSSGDPVTVTAHSGPFAEIIELVGQQVVAAAARPSGALHLEFGDGTAFDVDAPIEWETWQLRDEENLYLVVSDAGGGIVQFGEPDASVPRWTPVRRGPLAPLAALWHRVTGR